jgi:hypothetical protein
VELIARTLSGEAAPPEVVLHAESHPPLETLAPIAESGAA